MSLLIYYVRRDSRRLLLFLLGGWFLFRGAFNFGFFCHNFIDLYYGLTDQRHGSFTAGEGIMLPRGPVVNDCSYILQGARTGAFTFLTQKMGCYSAGNCHADRVC